MNRKGLTGQRQSEFSWVTISIWAIKLEGISVQALLRRGNLAAVSAALGMATLFLWFSHRFFNFALRFYGSASS